MERVMEEIRGLVAPEGIELVGGVGLEYPHAASRFVSWLEAGGHADMAFLERYVDIRRDPRRLLEGARSALIFALPYGTGERLTTSFVEPRVAQYARFRDYHRLLRRALSRVSDWLESHGHASRVCVDSAPLLERALAAKSGRGFIGKNTCFILRDGGSLCILAEVLTTADLMEASEESEAETSDCGTCRSCQIACPTGALDAAYHLDARRCLAYWSIENRGIVPLEFWEYFAKYWFGCDLCQLACPYNRIAQAPQKAREPVTIPDLVRVATMSQREYETYFGGTSLTRAGRVGLKRNALIALVATNDQRLGDTIQALRAQGDLHGVLAETVNQIPAFQDGFQGTRPKEILKSR